MKKIYIFLYTLLIIPTLLLSVSGCEDDKESEKERVSRLLSNGGSWNLQSATVGGVDQTLTYEGLELSFSPSDFSAVNGGLVWPASGTWEFESGSSNTIIRDDGMAVTIETIAEKELALAFTWDKDTFGSGRIGSISGEHRFVFSRP